MGGVGRVGGAVTSRGIAGVGMGVGGDGCRVCVCVWG